MTEIKWDIKRGADIYRQVLGNRLKFWISTGRIKPGEVVVWRSNFSGWRKPEEVEELIPYFRRYERTQLRKFKRRKLITKALTPLEKAADEQRSSLTGLPEKIQINPVRDKTPKVSDGCLRQNGVNPVRNTEFSRAENKISNGVKNILIIDDEKDLCQLLRDTLSSHGYNVQFAHTGKDALGSLKSQTPDLVFCDLKLPDGDGMKILSKIRRLNPSVIVNIITAYGSEEARDAARRLGAYSFIDKPFSQEDILGNIRELKL